MAKFNLFSAENLLMSVCGHLVVCAIMVTSFVVVLERARLVAPDRIQIMEIDLDDVVISGEETKLYNVGNDVKVSGEETKLYNVGQPEKTKPQEEKVVPKVEEKTKEPEPTEQEEIDEPTLAEEKKVEEKVEETKEQESKPVEEVPAPKKKRVIRVNREVLSLDRTLTVSVVDALRVAMTRCWAIDTKRPDISDIRAVAHLTMRRNGTVRDVWFESAARAETDPAFAYVLETIRSAINTCQPFRMLPENEFLKWEKIQLTFYPTQGKVM